MPVTNLPLFDEFDRDLLQRVRSFLCQKGYASHRTLEIKVQRGVVVVQGRVPSFYLRQIAVECIKHVAGVTQVVDLIEVADGPLPRQANGNSEDEQASPAASARHRTDSPVLARTAQDSHQTHFPNRHLLSSCKGIALMLKPILVDHGGSARGRGWSCAANILAVSEERCC